MSTTRSAAAPVRHGVHVALLAAAGAAVVAAALVVSLLPRRDAPAPADDETEPADRVPAAV